MFAIYRFLSIFQIKQDHHYLLFILKIVSFHYKFCYLDSFVFLYWFRSLLMTLFTIFILHRDSVFDGINTI